MNEERQGLKEQWKAQSPKTRRLLLLSAGLLLGILLLTWSGSASASRVGASGPQPAAEERTDAASPAEESRGQLEQELEAVLSCVRGAGRVRVAVWYSAGSESVYARNTESSAAPGGAGTDGGQEHAESSTLAEVGDQPWLVRQESPQIQGVAVIAEGAGDPAVKERLFSAVKGLLGLKAGQIAVVEGEGSDI